MVEWRAVVGFEGFYEVSDEGQVRSLNRIGADGRKLQGKPLRPGSDHHGRPFVFLYRDGGRSEQNICWLVAAAFIGHRPEGLYVCHIDGDNTNNRIGNLRYGTPSSNNRDAVRHGTHFNASKTQCPEGHEYTPENTLSWTSRSGVHSRRCRMCRNAQQRRNYQDRLARR